MKLLSTFLTLITFYSPIVFADTLECVSKDSNYSIDFSITTNESILNSKDSFIGDLYATANDDPSEVNHNDVLVTKAGDLLKISVRGLDELSASETLFAAVIDLSDSSDDLFYGVAYLKSSLEVKLPSYLDVLDSLETELYKPNGSGALVGCQIL